jgi:hypothetical protein
VPRWFIATLWVLLGVSLGLGVQPALLRWNQGRGCKETLITKYSPGHQMRVILSEKPCLWGLGGAAYFASLHIEKLGNNGWFMDMPLVTDSEHEDHVDIEWKDDDTLQVTINSYQYFGSFEHRIPGFNLIQIYTTPNEHDGGT